jgi:hypothetical protein
VVGETGNGIVAVAGGNGEHGGAGGAGGVATPTAPLESADYTAMRGENAQRGQSHGTALRRNDSSLELQVALPLMPIAMTARAGAGYYSL